MINKSRKGAVLGVLTMCVVYISASVVSEYALSKSGFNPCSETTFAGKE